MGTKISCKRQTWAERCISDPTHKEKSRIYAQKRRRNPKSWPSIILQDTRRTDKKFLRENDLDRDWIAFTIANGCFYCGETRLRMTLDRIDNNFGHTKRNVNPACIRCNYLRRDMPYEAWLIVAEGVKKARLAGAFTDWLGGNTRVYSGELEKDYSLPDEGEPED